MNKLYDEPRALIESREAGKKFDSLGGRGALRLDNCKELELLLDEAAEAYDAPDTAQVAEYLAANGVVSLPCRVGDKLYELAEAEDDDGENIMIAAELTVTEVGTARIFCSAFDPPRDDVGYVIPISELGVSAFFCREDAERALGK